MGLPERDITPPVQSENQTAVVVQRIRMTFTKEGTARYISHLDLARAVERALNRAELPVAYTQGFNRRPRLSLAAALPLGYTSRAEIADVWLTEAVDPQRFLARLAFSMPPGIAVSAAAEVELAAPSIQKLLVDSSYEVEFLEPIDEEALRADVAAVLAASSLVRERSRHKGDKPQWVDLRPLIIELEVMSIQEGDVRLLMRLMQTASQTGRPDDVLMALGIDPLDARVQRLALGFAAADSL